MLSLSPLPLLLLLLHPSPHTSLLLPSSPLRPSLRPSPLRPPTLLPSTPLTLTLAGLTTGSLHSISGPDHIAALLPSCVGVPLPRSARSGAVWGLGHSVSSSAVGVGAYLLAGRVGRAAGATTKWAAKAGSVTEVAVGLSMILIGFLGRREALSFAKEAAVASPGSDSVSVPAPRRKNSLTLLLNGLLHGLSPDGALTLAPALTSTSLASACQYLIFYSLGTVVAMSVATGAVGEVTSRVGGKGREDLPGKLAFWSSWFAMGVGFLWTGIAVMG